ncbi:MAG: glycoside hydrolase family 2 protein, partial [Actinobacteria bacterium]|nr:glycoside hydrolase family 2 protein [Actinomycetota bacterium]
MPTLVMEFDRGRIAGFPPGEGTAAGAHRLALKDGDWLDATIPGDVHSALIAAGRIPDPFYDRNEEVVRWVEDREWWYRLEFAAPANQPVGDERLQLHFAGLDTFATLWINGDPLGSHENMFRPATFDVTHFLRYGERNVLAVRFDPPSAHIDQASQSQWGRNPERAVMRKAQFGFGWDWGPRLPTIGIWRPAQLLKHQKAALAGVHFRTIDISEHQEQAQVAVDIEVERIAGETQLAANIELFGPITSTDNEFGATPTLVASGGLTFDSEGSLVRTCYLSIDKPGLWWTHDLGSPTLYELHVTLVPGDDRDNVLDRSRTQVGIRTLTLDQSPDPGEPGTRFFRFVLNGTPVFARGANWIPCDSFVGSVPLDRYDDLLGRAQSANMNMLRVWGGGIYEHDRFYELCDRLGLMVWQDFMFACAMYPESDEDFIAEVGAEARYQVRRLRNHPSLALWCGNNEIQWLQDVHFWEDSIIPPYGALYFDEVLPTAVAELDPQTTYWPSSPYGGNDHNSMSEGNRHNWDVWHGNTPRKFGDAPVRDNSPEHTSYRRYAEDMGRFISEFGLHAAPVMETLRRVIPSDQLFPHSDSLDHHNKDTPKDKGDNLMAAVTGLPATLEDYVDFSQLAQAEGLKFGVEHYRRRTPHCSGTLVWQLNDCWPALSWSVIDYYGFGKAAYYSLRRAFAPILASFAENGDSVELWITNNTLRALDDAVLIALKTFTGA